MSGRVDGDMPESSMVENVGVAVRIDSLALAVRVLFPLPVSTSGSVADISDSRCWPMSGRVGSAIFSGHSRKCGVSIEIASLTLVVRVLFPLSVSTPGFVADILGFRCPPISGYVGSATSRSGTVENVG